MNPPGVVLLAFSALRTPLLRGFIIDESARRSSVAPSLPSHTISYAAFLAIAGIYTT
jgi:hypothetical protein